MSNMLQHLPVCTVTYFRPTGEIRAVISTGGGVSSERSPPTSLPVDPLFVADITV